ncbi:MAG: hypothetical protein F6J97_13840, partial [Leptolyngbya sp. SIO4C1]|nr:hypothetical protein [Leptolyngbya sp. SIO4C1]
MTAAQSSSHRAALSQASPLELAQALAAQLAIGPNDWHRLSANRQARAQEQAAANRLVLLRP